MPTNYARYTGLRALGERPACPFIDWAWPPAGSYVLPELRCGCHLQGSVRILRTCQIIYLEARSIFFATTPFEFQAGPFQDFSKLHLRPKSYGFDPVHHLRYLALRRPSINLDDRIPAVAKASRANLKEWTITLAILRSNRWNLADLFLEDWDLTMLKTGQLVSIYTPGQHPFRLVCQLRRVGRIHLTWRSNHFDVLYDRFDANLTKWGEYNQACELIHTKAINEITSQPRPDKGNGMRRRKGGLTSGEIDQIEASFTNRVEELAVQEGLLTRFGMSRLL